MSLNVRPIIAEVAGATTSAAGALTAAQTSFDYWFRQFGTFVAILAGLFTIWSVIRKHRPQKSPTD